MIRLATTVLWILAALGSAAAQPAPASMPPARASKAAAPPPRLVLIAPPAELESAVRAALAPWRVVIEIERAPAPVDINGATELADRRRANAVAWLVPGQMVVFERGTADLVRRPAAGDPAEIDEARAAALALTLKTLMRLPEEPPPPEEAAPTLVAPIAVAVAPPPPPPWRIAAIAGGRFRLDGSLEPRVTLVGERALGALALAVDVAIGTGIDVDEQGFRGTWHDLAAGAVLMAPIHLGSGAAGRSGWRIAPGVGLSVHRTTLEGEFSGNAGGGGSRDLAETNAGVDAELGALWTRGHLGAGLRLSAGFIPYRDSFLLRNQNVFEVSPWEIELAAMVAAAF